MDASEFYWIALAEHSPDGHTINLLMDEVHTGSASRYTSLRITQNLGINIPSSNSPQFTFVSGLGIPDPNPDYQVFAYGIWFRLYILYWWW